MNSVHVMSMTVLDLQEQILPTTSVEKFSDPTNQDKSAQTAKEGGIKKVLTYLPNSPVKPQEVIGQALIDYTYIDNREMGASSEVLLPSLQDETGKILENRNFHIKSWEISGQDSYSKYLGMTWNQKDDHYLLKFKLNLFQRVCGIPSGEDLDAQFSEDKSAVNDPASLPIFYGTRIKEIHSQTTADNWTWHPGPLNPAALLTRPDSTLEKINSDFWLRGSFLLNTVPTWPTEPCTSLISSTLPSAIVRKLTATTIGYRREVGGGRQNHLCQQTPASTS